ncbi:MAG: hypothetical protein N3G21_07050 [Candidatus Hydrogenedentes bacterium]|nr:hypothetical protein [Candidatus Hydrogenedentota bacterium]
MFRSLIVLILCLAFSTLIFAQLPNEQNCPIPLWRKAEIFQTDMEKRFLLDGQALCKLILPQRDGSGISYNMPDNAYMTGIYVGTLSMKYLCTNDEKDLEKLLKSVDALHLLCRASGVPGLLARAVIPINSPWEDDGMWRPSPDGKYRWRGDVSSDQVDGVMFGFSWAYETVKDETVRREIAKDVTAIVEHILQNDLQIVDADGKPTTWGKYYPLYTRIEALNALLWLQALKIAYQVSQDEKYAKLYKEYVFDKKYGERAVLARRNLDPTKKGFVNHSDDVLFFLGVEPLLRLETDPQIREFYVKSLKRGWEGSGGYPGLKPESNPLHAFLTAKYLGDTSEVENAIKTLEWFPFTIKWNNDTIKSYEEQYGIKLTWDILSPLPEKGKPIPIDRREKTWSTWVQDPYHSAGNPNDWHPLEYNGHDYLLGYWLGRYYKFIPPDR